METLIFGGIIVNEGRMFRGSLVLKDDRISEIIEDSQAPRGNYQKKIDATGCLVLPGVIDDHVHFREPGLTQKADIESESRAAAAGGVTSYFEMPNTKPQTTNLETLDDKFCRAARESHVNYSFFFGATSDNVKHFAELDRHRIPGVKLFMGASTGNMLVDRIDTLEDIFRECERLSLPLMTHCEDTNVINENMAKAKTEYADPPIAMHPIIRSEDACYKSTALAVKLSEKYGTKLHVAHISTARELGFFGKSSNITGEAVIAHLYFSDKDYRRLGAMIKCNPAVKTEADRTEIRKALSDGRIATVGTDHAPHLITDKQGGCVKAASGMPMVQFSLVTMLELVDEGILTVERLVTLMAHNPATLFEVHERGFLRKGYKADIVIVKPHVPWIADVTNIESKCGWSPMLGHEFQWKVMTTICNGHIIYNKEKIDADYRGEEIIFR